MQKGFSVEGELIRSDDYSDYESQPYGGVINSVELDKIAVVPRPAYKPSIISAIYKSIGLKSQNAIRKSIDRGFTEIEEISKDADLSFGEKRFDIERNMMNVVESLFEDKEVDYNFALNELMKKYTDVLIPLLLRHKEDITGRHTDEEVMAEDSKSVKEKQIKKSLQSLTKKLSEYKE